MAKHFILKVTKVTYSPQAPWMVRVPPNLWDVEGQKKRFFAAEAVAKAYKDRLSRSMVNYQLQAAALTDAQRLEAFECFAKLEPLGASMRAAIDHYVAYLAHRSPRQAFGGNFGEALRATETSRVRMV